MAPELLGRISLNTTTSSQLRDSHEGIISLRYEETMEGKKPISVITVPPPRAPPIEAHPALRRTISPSYHQDPAKRDSGLAPTTSTKNSNNNATNKTEENGLSTTTSGRRSPKLQIPQSPDSTGSTSIWRLGTTEKKREAGLHSPASQTAEDFSPITIQIPTEDLIEMDLLAQMSFSKRGSMLLGGKKAVPAQRRQNPARRQPSFSMLASPATRVLSSELEEESQKVRSMYEAAEGASMNWRDGRMSALGDAEKVDEAAMTERITGGTPTSSQTDAPHPSSTSILSSNRGSTARREYELAGGLEDWEDILGADVDRYGFISIRRDSDTRPGTPVPGPPHRVSTVLQLASDTPRQQRRILGRAPSSARSTRSLGPRTASRKASGRSLKTVTSESPNRHNLRTIRSAVNHLPGNRDRRCVDEAGDMLTTPPGLADISESEESGKAAEALKMKEWSRAEKWRKMAKVVQNGKEGEGMEFEFDVKSKKLIERTWKGIPDRWRATAWFSFLSASAKKRKDSATDTEIVAAFHRLLDQSSGDDLQIDIDVPRTINSHIMFRRRYRGGQRLLFRVLHCLSLYFPETGYVQGMASLAATLLCYYDEEKTFIMLVRMWTLRGLDKLYAAGFGGLMSALDEFYKHWLAGSEVAKQLGEMNIDPTAYCTRWYLTLFNYSIPFAAQLRVWDVFMLLGDADPAHITPERPFGGGLDVIHAAGAALIEGTREIILDSDFENAMKVLTSWIPVKDEDMLMNITKVKWKLHHGKRLKARNLVTKPSTISKPSTA